MQPEKKLYPDANSTLRLAYGQVRGYEARDAVYFNFQTDLDGIMEKYIPGDEEFDLPTRLVELHKSKDYGRYGVNGTAGIRDALPGWRIGHERGAGIVDEDPASYSAALEAAGKADVVLLCLGESATMCGEATSRAHPDLPRAQRRLAEAVFALGKPVIVALGCGRPLTVSWLFERADAVLATWFLGSEAGPALADVLTGQYNPSGKLPVSWPRDVGQMPIFYAQRPTGRPADPGNAHTSRYIDVPNEPQFPFGHGLSYTRFAYRSLRLSASAMAPGETVAVEADIANEGAADGEETAFLFIRDPVASIARPVLELKGVAKITLAAGSAGTVRFDLCRDDIAFPDEAGNSVLESGTVEILVGPRADRQALLKGVLEVRAGQV